MLTEVQKIIDELYRVGYISDPGTATVLYLAQALHKPILVEGPAGVGKTAIAQAFAAMKSMPLIRLQCYEGIDEAKALYEWNYKKQLLHIQAVSNQQVDVEEVEKQIFSEEFLLTRPLLQAITSEQPSCLLIDEIDKVDFEFEAMLLELLSEYQVTLPELGTVKARHIPIVFLTSNATRELSEALKRRCLYVYLDFPVPEVEQRILELKVSSLETSLAVQLTAALSQLRSLPLRKPPSIAESIDWALALVALGVNQLEHEILIQTLNVVLKHRDDIEKAKARYAAPR
ncbi:MAG: AAA family ATPase [Acidobacteriota bacterium]